MLTYYSALAVACILIILLIFLAPAQPLPETTPRPANEQPIPIPDAVLGMSEHFDTFRNHDMASAAWRSNVLGDLGMAVGAKPSVSSCKSCAGSPATMTSPMVGSNIDRYTWNERDASGDNIYDKVYEQQMMRQYSPVVTKYGRDDIFAMNSGSATIYFNGEPVTLSQSG